MTVEYIETIEITECLPLYGVQELEVIEINLE